MQITRALMVISILLSCLAVMSSMAGMECTTCMDDKQQLKVKVAFGGAVLFVTAGKIYFTYFPHLCIVFVCMIQLLNF